MDAWMHGGQALAWSALLKKQVLPELRSPGMSSEH